MSAEGLRLDPSGSFHTHAIVATGIPLSWKKKKGALHSSIESHRWIGIEHSLTAEGAVMKLPAAYLLELSHIIVPLCHATGAVSFSDLDVIIGKAARVAHVVPQAKPFVAGGPSGSTASWC